jgi:CheY-like chemotaxis protein
MNAVIGFAHLLKRDPLTPRQRDHLGKISDASEHLLQVINDILDFSKIEAHKVTLESADFALRECLERVLALQMDAARAKQLPLRLMVADDCPPVLRGDRLRLEQILLNLLSNAVKFTAQGHVDIRVLRLADPSDLDWLRIEVTDTGIGMTESQLEHVFEAFAQADLSTTRRYGGTGLGLAICKRLVELKSGRIGASSQPNQGSTFWVELPFRRAEAGTSAAAAAAAALAPGQPDAARARLLGARVLLAEDNPINQEVAAALLTALGVAVDMASNGEEALQRFDRTRHDLVLMDVQMPGMDGLRTTEALRQRPDGREVPIVAMTANAFSEDRAACLAAGMNDYLSKPVDPATLADCLMRWLRPAPTKTTTASTTAGTTASTTAGTTATAPPPALGPSTSDDGLRQRVQALEGLDSAGPLARMRGSWPLYLRTVRLFVEHHRADVVRLRDPAALADPAALQSLAHSLAGAAATVGAVDVQQRAQQLQRGLDAGQAAAPEALQAVAAALERLLQHLQDAPRTGAAASFAGPATAPASAQATAAGRAALLALQPLVQAHDTAALPLCVQLQGALRAALGVEAETLQSLLSDYNFAAARSLLATALGRLGGKAPD